MRTRWVLLRGLGREAGHWGPFARALQERTGDVVVALDLPGSGARRDEDVPWRVAVAAQRCRAVLPPHEGPTVLLALSLGAMVALEWCRQDPRQVAGCVLVNTSAGNRNPFWQRLRPARYPTVARMLAGMPPAARENRVLALTSARPQDHAAALAVWNDIARQRPVRPAAVLRQLWSAARYRAPSEAPAVALLVLASVGDRLVDPACSRRLAGRWNLPLVEHPWAGHDLPLDDPAWVLEQVQAWWTGVRGAPPR